MKFLSLQSIKRIQFMKWGRRMTSTGSAATLISVQRRASCCCSAVLKQLVSSFRIRWKKSLWWQKSRDTAQYSYDLHSYSLNFDDGFCRDPPLRRRF